MGKKEPPVTRWLAVSMKGEGVHRKWGCFGNRRSWGEIFLGWKGGKLPLREKVGKVWWAVNERKKNVPPFPPFGAIRPAKLGTRKTAAPDTGLALLFPGRGEITPSLGGGAWRRGEVEP